MMKRLGVTRGQAAKADKEHPGEFVAWLERTYPEWRESYELLFDEERPGTVEFGYFLRNEAGKRYLLPDSETVATGRVRMSCEPIPAVVRKWAVGVYEK